MYFLYRNFQKAIIFFLFISIFSLSSEAYSMEKLKISDVIDYTLHKDPQIKIKEDIVNSSLSAYKAAGGIFDSKISHSIVDSKENTPYPEIVRSSIGKSKKVVTTTSYDFSLSRKFRSGIIVNPTVKIQRQDDKSDIYDTMNNGRFQFNFIIPLKKGRGKRVVTSEEKAAWFEYQASINSLLQTKSERVYNSLAMYWNYIGEWKKLKIAGKAEKKAEKMVENMKELIRMGERPAAELKQLEGYLSSRTAEKLSCLQSYREAKEALFIAIGFSNQSELKKVEIPDVKFPKLFNIKKLIKNRDKIIKHSFEKRWDIISYINKKKAAKKRLINAKDNLKNEVNLNVSMGYNGIKTGTGIVPYFNSIKDGIYGINTMVKLNYDLSVNKRAEFGNYKQALSNLSIVNISLNDLKRNISSSINVALSNLDISEKILKEAEVTVSYYAKAFDNEKSKLDIGMATVLDVMNVEDRLIAAKKNLISSRIRYALSISRIWYETGMIVDKTGKIRVKNFPLFLPNFDKFSSKK